MNSSVLAEEETQDREISRRVGPLDLGPLPHILVVDDNISACETMAEILEGLPAKVTRTLGSGAALKSLSQGFDVVVTDYMMPGATGIDLLRVVKKVSPKTEVVLVTGFSNVDDAVRAMKEGACDYLQKPIQADQLLAITEKAVERGRMRRELEELRRRVREKGEIASIITCSQNMRAVLRLVQGVAATQATVLILGESGTGKELVARAIVAESDRNANPFFTINCAALTETLVESELFGHAKGAFTGAIAERRGVLGEADGGTVFLDEVGELPPATQSKLLRFLETGEIQRVGEPTTEIVDVRVVAATNRDLRKDVREGRFREDLFFRLNVIVAEIPPLRDRPADVLPLAESFVHDMNEKHDCAIDGFSRNARDVLMRYPWPGNVRELRNWVERCVIVKGEGTLEVDDLRNGNREVFAETETKALHWPEWTLDRLDAEYIRHVLEKERGNRTAAAGRLGISRVTLWRRLKEMGID